MYTILSIDGGGARGLIPARVLAHLERRLIEETGNEDLRLGEAFDLISGTSAGGVLALIYTLPPVPGGRKYTATQVWQQFMKMLPGVFSVNLWKKINTVWGLSGTKYEATRLETWLRFFFHRVRLSGISTPCLVTAYDFISQSPICFKSHAASPHSDTDFFLFDVARATSAAPSYFAPHRFSDVAGAREYFCSDGILSAYSPALAAYAEVRALSGHHNAAHMHILSLGTGQHQGAHNPVDVNDWGGLHWGATIGKLMADCSALNVDEQLRQVFLDSPQNYVRVNPELDENCSLDMDCVSAENLEALNAVAERCIQENHDALEATVATVARACLDRNGHSPSSLPRQVAPARHFRGEWQLSIPSYIAGGASRVPERRFCQHGRASLDCAQLDFLRQNLRTGLRARFGIARGARAAIALADPLSALALAHILTDMGVVFSFYSRSLTAQELLREIDNGVRLLFADNDGADWAAAAGPGQFSVVWVRPRQLLHSPTRAGNGASAWSRFRSGLRKFLPGQPHPGVPVDDLVFTDLPSSAGDAPVESHPAGARDQACLQTRTGQIYSHRNLVAGAEQLLAALPDSATAGTSPPVFVVGMPAHSHTALVLSLVLAPRLGACVVFASARGGRPGPTQEWQGYDNLHLFAPPEWFEALLGDRNWRPASVDLRSALSISERISAGLSQRWQEITGVVLRCGWAFPDGPLLGYAQPATGATALVEACWDTEFCAPPPDGDSEAETGHILVRGPQLPEWAIERTVVSSRDSWRALDGGARLDQEGRLLLQTAPES